MGEYAYLLILEKFMIKLRNAGSDLFRFVLDPTIPPTNNAAERGLREIVVHRKIRGSIRAEETMTWMAKFLFMRNDMEEQKVGLPGRDCKIRLKMGQTT